MISRNSIIEVNKIDKERREFQLADLKKSQKIELRLHEIFNNIKHLRQSILCYTQTNKSCEQLKFEGDGGGGGAQESTIKSSISSKLLLDPILTTNFEPQVSNILQNVPGILQKETNLLVLLTGTVLVALVLATIFQNNIGKSFTLLQIQIIFLIMQISKIQFGLPLIGWRVKPDPGD